MDLAEQIAAEATEITREDLERLWAHALDDGEIVSVVLAAAARCFFSKTLDALGIEPDASYAELDRSCVTSSLSAGRSPRRAELTRTACGERVDP
jgi:hypothetical protein